MTGNRFIAIIAAMGAIGAALAVAGLYVDWRKLSAPPGVEQGPVARQDAPALPAEPKTATPAEEMGTKSAEATGALTPPSEPTSVPTFDVVVIEPSGEGVIAGRAAPGWKVSVQSGGTKVAEVKADLQGEWSVVLDKPLPAGDHALSLKILSPDGTKAVSSQETVRVAVGTSGAQAVPAAPAPQPQPQPQQAGSANVAPPPAPPAEAPASLAEVEPNVTRALARAEREALNASAGAPPQSKPALVFKTVDYELSGAGTGTVTITGSSEPGAKIAIYYSGAPFAEARADRNGNWRVTVAKTLGMGEHSFRAERAGAAPGTTVAALISIERVEAKPEAPAPQVAASGPAGQVAAVQGAPGAVQDAKEVYVIRRGDTLWAIAKRHLGSGLRYTSIFQDNRTVINNPHLIHPQQEVTLPKP
jgi:nucleoid-associated protein YgaU